VVCVVCVFLLVCLSVLFLEKNEKNRRVLAHCCCNDTATTIITPPSTIIIIVVMRSGEGVGPKVYT